MSNSTVLTQLRFRRATAAQWASVNPVLAAGEPAFETDTSIQKIGDGVTAYNLLPDSINGAVPDATSAIAGKVKVTDSTQLVALSTGTKTHIGVPVGFVNDGGTTDQSAKLLAAVVAAQSVPADPSFNDALNRPVIIFEPGAIRVTAQALVTASACVMLGAGQASTKLYVDFSGGDTSRALFQVGANTLTNVGDIFSPTGSVQAIRIEDMTVSYWYGGVNNTGPIGSRNGQFFKQVGGGSAILRNLTVTGFKYAINCACGGDFNDFSGLSVNNNDVGYYFGPGSQQGQVANCTATFNYENLVIDRPGNLDFINCTWNSPLGPTGIRGKNIVIESYPDVGGKATTRQLTGINLDGSWSMNGRVLFIGNWFESAAGGALEATPLYHVTFDLRRTDDTWRGASFIHNYVSSATTVLAFVGSIGTAFAPQQLEIGTTTWAGNTTNFTDGVGPGFVISGQQIGAVPALATASHVNDGTIAFDIVGNASERRVNAGSLTQAYSNEATADTDVAGKEGIRTTYVFGGQNGEVWEEFFAANAWRRRMARDIQHSKLYLGDTTGGAVQDAPSIDFGSAIPVSGEGKFTRGSVRYSTVSTSGTPKEWRCSVTGTPGTWVAGTNWP